MADDPAPAGVLLDLDGTLVDSVYQHVVAWHEAFRDRGYDVPQARIHAGIGMGGDRLVPWLLGGHVPDAEELSSDHKRRFLGQAGHLRRTRGALELLDDLARREVPHVVATSASTEEREALLDVLGRDDVPLVDSEGVASSKPAPDLLLTACERLGLAPERAVMVGDAPWDGFAARAAGVAAVAVRCGGFGDDALRAPGVLRIVDAPGDLVGQL